MENPRGDAHPKKGARIPLPVDRDELLTVRGIERTVDETGEQIRAETRPEVRVEEGSQLYRRLMKEYTADEFWEVPG
jgi:hypothetical protein